MLLPGPSYLESYSLCQWDTDAGTECLMLPVVSVIPDVSGIGYSSPEGPSQRRPGFLARSCLYAAKVSIREHAEDQVGCHLEKADLGRLVGSVG